MRLHRHAARRGALPDRHRHRVRPARPRVDPAARPGRRLGHRRRRHVEVRLPRALGAECARDPGAADDGSARLPVHARARARGRERPLPRAARDLRRRARLGALLPVGVRAGALGHDLGGRSRARPRRGRLQGDRLAAAREGLPRLGLGHHGRRHPVRGRARLRGQARQGVPGQGGARRGGRARSGGSAA